MLFRKVFYAFLASLLSCQVSYGSVFTPVQRDSNSASFLVDHSLPDSWLLSSLMRGTFSVDSSNWMQVNNSLFGRILESNASNRFNNDFELSFTHQFNENWAWSTVHQSSLQSDADFLRASLATGIVHDFSPNMRGGVRVGPVLDHIQHLNDNGAVIEGEFALDRKWIEDVLVSGDASTELDFLSNDRQNTDIDLQANAFYSSSEGGSLSVQTGYRSTHRDYYAAFLDKGRIATRQEQVFSVGLTVDYPVGDQTTLVLRSQNDIRNVTRYDRKPTLDDISLVTRNFDELQLSVEASLYGTFTNGALSIGVVLDSRTNNNTILRRFDAEATAIDLLRDRFARLDNKQSYRSLFASGRLHVGNADTLALQSSVGLLRYDTPSEDNTDDRDELRYVLGLYWNRSFSRYLHMEVVADLDLFHKVYINSEASSQNNWNRVIRLAPTVSVVSGPITSVATFEVLANYTTYDFENSGAQPRSFSLRQLRLHDSLSIALNSHEFVVAEATMRRFDRSILFWNSFSESPFETNTEYSVSVLAGTKRIKGVSVGAGFRLYDLKKEPLQGGVATRRQTLGPQVEAIVQVWDQVFVAFDFWYEFVFDGEFEIRRLPFVNIETRIEY